MTLKWYPNYDSPISPVLQNLFSNSDSTLHIAFIAVILSGTFISILPGIRGRERKYSLIRHTIWFICGLGLCSVFFGQSWITAIFGENNPIQTENLKFEPELRTSPSFTTEFPTKLGNTEIFIGLRRLNITFLHPEYPKIPEFYNEEFDFRTFQFENLEHLHSTGKPLQIIKLASWLEPNNLSRKKVSTIGRSINRAGRGAETILILAVYFWICAVILLQVSIEPGIDLTIISGVLMFTSGCWYITVTQLSKSFRHGIYLDGEFAEFRYGWCVYVLFMTAVANLVFGCVLKGMLVSENYREFLEEFLAFDPEEGESSCDYYESCGVSKITDSKNQDSKNQDSKNQDSNNKTPKSTEKPIFKKKLSNTDSNESNTSKISLFTLNSVKFPKIAPKSPPKSRPESGSDDTVNKKSEAEIVSRLKNLQTSGSCKSLRSASQPDIKNINRFTRLRSSSFERSRRNSIQVTLNESNSLSSDDGQRMKFKPKFRSAKKYKIRNSGSALNLVKQTDSGSLRSASSKSSGRSGSVSAGSVKSGHGKLGSVKSNIHSRRASYKSKHNVFFADSHNGEIHTDSTTLPNLFNSDGEKGNRFDSSIAGSVQMIPMDLCFEEASCGKSLV